MEASQQDPNTPAESQEQPTQDSGLQTPQPDQPVPTEAERQDQGSSDPTPEYPSNEDQKAQYDKRETELEQVRREHNERTGGGTVAEGERQAQRDEHNTRVAGTQDSDQA